MTDRTKETIKSPAFTAPLLVMFVIVAMLISRRALTTLNPDTNIFVAIGVIQLSVLAIPCMLYYLIKGRKLSEPIRILSKDGPQLLFLLFAALFFICGTLLIKFFYFVGGGTVASVVNVYDGYSGESSEAVRQIEIILSMIVIPAVCEEFLFRGIVFGEYLRYGTANAVIMSALCFSLFHFSFENFFVYFFTGLVFGFVAAMTRSILPSIALHLLSNTLSIYASDAFLRITVVKNGAYFIGFVLTILAGVTLILLLSRTETICYSIAERPHTESIPPKSVRFIGKVFLSPSFILLVVFFICFTLFLPAA